NANPLVGQGANGGMVRNAVLPLLLVISPRPERLFSGRIREFVKGLAQELGTGPAPVHPAHLAARRSDGSDARELLNLFGALIAVAVSAERGGQARAQGFSGAGQAVTELLVGRLAPCTACRVGQAPRNSQAAKLRRSPSQSKACGK